VRFFIDENLSRRLALALSEAGHDSIHPRQVGRRGQRDDTIVRTCIAEDRIIITRNVIDFVRSLAREDVHPGLIGLPDLPVQQSIDLVLSGLAFVRIDGQRGADRLVNHGLLLVPHSAPRLMPLHSSASLPDFVDRPR
jgi:predicted nuclease of predicted toxin-antitoxin system